MKELFFVIIKKNTEALTWTTWLPYTGGPRFMTLLVLRCLVVTSPDMYQERLVPSDRCIALKLAN